MQHLDGQGINAQEVRACLLRPVAPARTPQDLEVRAFVCKPGQEAKQVALSEFSWDPTVPVYTDGSVVYPDIPELACGASAAYQLLPSGEQRWIEIQLPADAPQTAVLTEHIAFVEASKLAKDGAIVVVVDCQAVITTWHWARGRQLSYKHKHAGCWVDFDQCSVTQVHKIKSHQSKLEAELRGEGQWHRGNLAADLQAAAAVSGHLDPEAADKYRKDRIARVQLLRTALGSLRRETWDKWGALAACP